MNQNPEKKFEAPPGVDDISPAARRDRALAELDEWISVLHRAERMGLEKDEPEGSRFIQISSTLADNMADCLRELRDTAIRGTLDDEPVAHGEHDRLPPDDIAEARRTFFGFPIDSGVPARECYPIVSMVEHQNRLFVATEERIFELKGDRFKSVGFSQ